MNLAHFHILARSSFAAALMAGTLTTAVLAGEDVVKDRAGLAAALKTAGAGTVIRLAPGTYDGGLAVSAIKGTREQPVVITAAKTAEPPVIEGGASGLQLSGCHWVELSHLHFSGATANGLNIDDGGRGQPPSKGIVLRHLVVTNTGPAGNRDGIKLSGLDDFTVEHCRVVRWGAGGSAVDMVGCHQGVVQDCEFQHDGLAAAGANGVQMKGGSGDITVRRCRFFGTGGRGVNLGGSTGADYFRPAGARFEARNLTVEDCLFTDVEAPVAFVGVDGATVRYNTLYRPGRWALRILQENRGDGIVRCRNGVFSHNIICFQSGSLREAVNIGPDTEPQSFRFEANAWHCEDKPDVTRRLIRLPAEETKGTYGVEPRFRNPENGDFSLHPESKVQNAGLRTETSRKVRKPE